jgi:hypothetical protein
MKATAAYPPLIQRSHTGGQSWGEKFRALPQATQQRIVTRMALGTVRYFAKKRGAPLPIPYIYEAEPLPDGGIGVKPGSMRPMTREEILSIVPNWFDE